MRFPEHLPPNEVGDAGKDRKLERDFTDSQKYVVIRGVDTLTGVPVADQ